jgi:CDP-diacylglycerol--glycerol-3-phosphate 3-phosphatidyltransferase
LNLPNQITIARLLLSAALFVLLGQYAHPTPKSWILDVALVLFLVAAITDYIDGYLARKYGLVTALGRILDPFVDKVLMCGAFVYLAGPQFVDDDGRNVTGIARWMVVVILGREMLVTGLRGYSESRGIAFGAGWSGKAKLWVQTTTVGVALLTVAHEPEWVSGHSLRLAFAWLTVLVTVLSMGPYVIKARTLFSDERAS